MIRWRKRTGPTRAELVDRKHQLEGQINVLAAELKRLHARGEPTDALETQLDQLQKPTPPDTPAGRPNRAVYPVLAAQ